MSSFGFFGIDIKIVPSGLSVLMMLRDDLKPADSHVVYADPKKLAPHLEGILSQENKEYRANKMQHTLRALEAAKASPIASRIILPEDRPIPIAKATVSPESGKIVFSDGITRSAALSKEGAQYIPLQVRSSEVAHVQRLVGADRAPVSAQTYVVPAERAMERQIQWYEDRQARALDPVAETKPARPAPAAPPTGSRPSSFSFRSALSNVGSTIASGFRASLKAGVKGGSSDGMVMARTPRGVPDFVVKIDAMRGAVVPPRYPGYRR